MNVEAQTAPARWEDLPKLAAKWPAAWAAVVNEPLPDDFENEVLRRVDDALRAQEPSKETYPLAESVLSAALRRHLSLRRGAPLADSPAHTLQAKLEDRLSALRADWLKHLQKAGSDAEARQLAERWLPAAANDGALRTALNAIWFEQAKAALAGGDAALAQILLDRLENFGAAQSDEIRKLLHARIIGLRDKARDKSLIVAVRALPVSLSPATAWTEVEKQALPLLFDRLIDRDHARRYTPQVALSLPTGSLTASLPLRRDVYWSNGERVTVADVRHTALLMNQDAAAGRAALWRDYLDVPRLEGNLFQLNLTYRQGLFDPMTPLTFWILPQKLARLDDADFAKAPFGSGPFAFVTPKEDDDKSIALFQMNPYDVRPGHGNIRELRMVTWADPRKDLPKPLPHLILDAPTEQLPAFKEMGYVESAAKNDAVGFLAVNHRRPALTNSVRQAIAHALDRQALLDRHFRGGLKEKHHATVNGLFPRDSWAAAPQVPVELFRLEQAKSLARKVKMDMATLQLTLKYPAGDERVKAACEEMGQTIVALFQEAEVKAKVQVQGLAPAALRRALDERDYDLMYLTAEGFDDPVGLALLFDRQDSALRPGGSNYLGYDNDDLHKLLRAAVQHRQFKHVEDAMQAIHVHLTETMPVIPLWRLDMHVLVHKSLRTPQLDARAVFANVREWKVMP